MKSQIDTPVMRIYLVERLVIHRRNKARVGSLSIRSLYLQSPFFILAGIEAVTECLPLHEQTFVGQRFPDSGIVAVHNAVFHPRVCNKNSVTVLVFICELAVMKCIALVYDAAFEHLLASKHIIYYMLAGLGRTYLQIYRATI